MQALFLTSLPDRDTHRDGRDLPTCRLLSPSRNVHTKHGCLSLQFSSVTLLCLTLCSPMDCSMPGLPVHHRLLELTQTHVHWVGDAIQLSHPLSSPSPLAFNLSQHQGLFKQVSSSHQVAKVCLSSSLVAKSRPTLLTPWTVACQAPLSMGFSRQEYWSGLPFPSLGDLPDPGIEPVSPALQEGSMPWEIINTICGCT